MEIIKKYNIELCKNIKNKKLDTSSLFNYLNIFN